MLWFLVRERILHRVSGVVAGLGSGADDTTDRGQRDQEVQVGRFKGPVESECAVDFSIGHTCEIIVCSEFKGVVLNTVSTMRGTKKKGENDNLHS